MQAIQLRDYQIQLIEETFTAWKKREKVLLQLATGGGKTVIFASLAKEFTERGKPILAIAHREELITQAANKIREATQSPVGIIKAGYKPDADCPIQVASIGTLIRRDLPPAELVVFDEAHHCHSKSYAKIFKSYAEKGSHIMGCTATPARTDGRGLRWLFGGVAGFDTLISGPPVKKLIEQKHLSPFKFYSPTKIIQAANAGLKTTGGDYNAKELADLVRSKCILGDAVETWKKYAQSKSTVVFAPSVEYSQELALAYHDASISAAHLDGETDTELRREILSKFAIGEIKVLCQHSIVTEGTDIVGIECLQFLRPTKSISLWFQAIGRALRPAPGKVALIIDHTDTHLMLPWPDDEIDWSLDPISLPPGKYTIRCPHCHHVFRPHLVERAAQQATCPVCLEGFALIQEDAKGEKIVEPISVPEIFGATFEEISNEYNALKLAQIQEIIEEQKRRGFQRGWVYYRLREIAPTLDLSLSDWREISRRLGYKPGWGWHQWMEMQTHK